MGYLVVQTGEYDRSYLIVAQCPWTTEIWII